ncbi:MAG: SMI1/KNR4 family protein [Kofleriaceae bacterium]|nr:SMI1/KNR4 family protein [Kofleriaceae bacterium]
MPRVLIPPDLWNSGPYSATYIDDPLTPDKIADVERTLGYRLPAAYVELMRSQNGGLLKRGTVHPMNQRTSWSSDHIAITGIFAIGRTSSHSLCGVTGSQFFIDDWGYPPIGVYFADCPSAGHDMVCLDYRACGPQGEPAVVHVDEELDYRITPVAPSFEAFIRGLEHRS